MSAAAPARVAAPIGLLGGSFDPIHTGHLQLARAAQTALDLGELVFVPAGRPWQKGSITPAAQRLEMLALALGGNPRWRIDARETGREGPSYTVDTLHQIRKDLPAAQPLVWIMGFDQLCRLATWHRWEDLRTLAHIAFARRGPGALDEEMSRYIVRYRGTAADLARSAAGAIVEFPMEPVDCSSTQIRRALAAADRPRVADFVPAPVLDFIRDHQLYAPTHG